MYLMHGVRQRVTLLVVALVLLLAAGFALGARYGWWPKPFARPDAGVLADAGAMDRDPQAIAIGMVVIGGVMVLLALWWVASLVPRRVRDAHLQWVEGGSVTKLDAKELGRRLADALAQRAGVSQADVAVHGSSLSPRLIVQVTAEASADLESVRDAVVDAVIRPGEAMLARPFAQIDVEYHATSQRAASARADLDLSSIA